MLLPEMIQAITLVTGQYLTVKSRSTLNIFPRNEFLLDSVEDTEALQKLKRFSQEFYTAEKWNDTLVFNDLRFGQMMGWQNPRNKFVFHYFLKDSADNTLGCSAGSFCRDGIRST